MDSVDTVTVQPLRPDRRPLPLGTAVGLADVPAVHVSGATLDSRLVCPGDLYIALPGTRVHGAAYADEAVARGAAAILTDAAGRTQVSADVPVVVVDDPRGAMARAAATIYGDPAEELTMFGVTGTNGKTTTAFMVADALRATGRSVGTIGTIGFLLDGVALEGARTTVTTPESPELQALLAVMAERGADAVAMEVSSHAMALHRADAITFDVAGFTNLGRDHLDFHGTMEDYFAAKASLFTAEHARSGVINADDAWGVRLLDQVRRSGDVAAHSCGWESEADYRVREVGARGDGRLDVVLTTPSGDLGFVLGLPGDHNVRNAATTLAMVDVAGLDARAASLGLADVTVPGRLQRIGLGEGAPEAYVDFAHTPQAVTAAVDAFAGARAQGRRLVVVVGCGGDRDATKRGPMGAAAARADVAVVTDDNPRSEDPAAIRSATLAGAREAASGAEVVDGGDRRSAIAYALEAAGPDGIVAVLGKGHEQGQDIGGVVTPFDDVAVITEEWARLRGQEGESPWKR
ncbi:UDP-N-acetylmuramoyl-L-alanyl-D-glutamate--2,6-diaminopimelate ligase [Mariniluteicoccus flavus]